MKSRHLIGKLHAASRAGYSVCLHRPTQGWTVGEYILLCKVSRLHPPSSLGLDGEGKPQPHHDDQQEVQKEPSSTYIPIGICWSFMKVERRHLVFQAPDRHYIHTILTPYGILCRASKYHKKWWSLHLGRVYFRSKYIVALGQPPRQTSQAKLAKIHWKQMVFSSHYTICGNSIIPNVAILLYRMWIVRRLFEEHYMKVDWSLQGKSWK